MTESNAIRRTHKFLFGPVPSQRLTVFARCLSAALFVYVFDRARTAREWLTHDGFHFSSSAQNYWEPPPMPPLPTWALPVFLLIFFTALGLMVAGWYLRFAIWPTLLGVTYVTLVDTAAAFTLNILFIVSFTILAVSPWRAVADASRQKPQYHSAWPLRILQTTILTQYCTAGWCKITNGDWMQNPYALWSHAQGIYRTDFASLLLRTLPKEAWAVMQYGALAFELLCPILLIVPRLRTLGILWGLGFNIMISLTMYKLILFNLQLFCFFLLFVPTERFRLPLAGKSHPPTATS